jgi:two-component system, cell cycle sensor histidine kinase and response regulator CckA
MLRQTFPKTIGIALALHEPMPEVNADHTQIHQALLNLGVNARDAMPDGGTLTFTTSMVEPGQLKARIADADDGAYVCIEVTDTGVGMDANARSRAFEPFFTTKGPGSGTGLGLAVVYGVLHVHRGFVELESEVGHGTTIRLYLPIGPEGAPARVEKAAAPERRHEGPATVLIVEDEALVSDLLRRVLQRAGFEVLVANDGEEGVETYRRHASEVDVVLMDFGLPKLAGDQAFERIKEIDPAAKVVIASGNLDATVKERLEAAGLLGFIQKPYSNQAVVETIRRVLASGGR